MKIGIIIGSVREERKGPTVAEWVLKAAQSRPDAAFEVIDLRAFDVPLFTSATNPALADRHYASPQVAQWSAAIDACDGFIFVTPEYNHGIPGAFKNAVDSLGPEWIGKAVAFVSYGADGGVRAVEQWRQVVVNFRMSDVRAQVALSLFAEFTPEGDLAPAAHRAVDLATLLDQITQETAIRMAHR